jgi:hypothetical protein
MAKTIADSDIKEMLYFSIKESIEFAKASNEDYGLAVEKKLQAPKEEKGHGLSKSLAAIVERPIIWYLSEHKLIPNNGCGIWAITKRAEKFEDKDFEEIKEKIWEERRIYFRSNFESEGYNAS